MYLKIRDILRHVIIPYSYLNNVFMSIFNRQIEIFLVKNLIIQLTNTFNIIDFIFKNSELILYILVGFFLGGGRDSKTKFFILS